MVKRKRLGLVCLSALFLGAACSSPPAAEMATAVPDEVVVEQAVDATVEARLRATTRAEAAEATQEAADKATSTAIAQSTATAIAAYRATETAELAAYNAGLTATAEAERRAIASATAVVLATATARANALPLTMLRNWSEFQGYPERDSYNAGYPSLHVVWSPDGKTLATGNMSGFISLRNAADGTLIRELQAPDTDRYGTGSITSLAWSPDGQYIVSGDRAGTLRVRRVADGTEAHQEDLRYFVTSIAWSPDGETLATANAHGLVNLYSAADFSSIREFDTRSGRGTVLAWKPDGETILTAESGTMRLWRVSDGSLLTSFDGSSYNLPPVQWSPDGDMIVTAENEPWMVRSDGSSVPNVLSKQVDQTSLDLTFSSNGKFLTDGTTIWQAGSGLELRPIPHPDDSAVESVAWSPDGTLIAIGYSNGSVWMWQVTQPS